MAGAKRFGVKNAAGSGVSEVSGRKKSTREDVLGQALNDIRGKFGDGAIMLLGEEKGFDIPVVSTGLLPLDIALVAGGLPRGRIVEIFGPEGGGKTTIALHCLAQIQKEGGVAAFIDAEHALDPHLAQGLGVDISKLYLSQPDSGEQSLYILDTLVKSGAVDVVVVDSVAALTPQKEIDGDITDGSQVGLQARMMSYALRKLTSSISKTKTIVIFINQLRATINQGYSQGPTETTSGGRALKFYSSIRIEVRRGKSINKGDTAIGHELYLKVVKNKVAPPFRTAHTSLIYGRGVPEGNAIVDLGLEHGILKQKGAWVAYKGETLAQGKEGTARLFESNVELRNEIKKQIIEKVKSEGMAGYVTAEDEAEDEIFNSFEDKEEDKEKTTVRLDDSDEPLEAESGGAGV